MTPAGPVDGVSSTRDLTVPAFPTTEGRSVFPMHMWRSPPSVEKSAKFRLQPPETAVLQSGDQGHSLHERANAPDVSLEGPFDIHRVRHHPATPLRSLPEGQSCPFHITSYDLEIGETDSSQEYGVQLHDPRLLEYVGAPESVRLLSRSTFSFVVSFICFSIRFLTFSWLFMYLCLFLLCRLVQFFFSSCFFGFCYLWIGHIFSVVFWLSFFPSHDERSNIYI